MENLISVLRNWYDKLYDTVRWNDATSHVLSSTQMRGTTGKHFVTPAV